MAPWGPEAASAESCTHPAKRDGCFPPLIAERQRLPKCGNCIYNMSRKRWCLRAGCRHWSSGPHRTDETIYVAAVTCNAGHLPTNMQLTVAPGTQSLATNSPAPGPRPLTCGVSSECLGTRSYETTSRDQRGKIQMFFSSTGACTAAKFPIANHHSQINTQLYSASLIRLIWQQRHSDSEFDAL